MTTIAFDGRILATDSMITGFAKAHRVSKMYIVRQGNEIVAIAGCGSAAAFAPAAAWFLNDGSPENYPSSDIRLTVIKNVIGNTKPTVLLVEGSGRRLIAPAPHVDGSGGETAMGALLAGKSAPDAILIAAMVDPATAAPIVAFDMVEGKWVHAPEERALDELQYLIAPYLTPAQRKRKATPNKKSK